MREHQLKLTTLLISALLFQTAMAVSQPQTTGVLSPNVDITPVVTFKVPRQPGTVHGRTYAWDFSTVSNTLAVILTVDNVVRLFLFDLKTGAARRDVELSRRSDRFNIENIAFSPDGSRIAIPMGEDRKLTLWNAVSGQKETEAATETEVKRIDWVGATIAVVAGKYIEFWKAQPLIKEGSIKAGRTPTEWPMTAELSPDERYLAILTNTPAVYIATRSTSTPLPLVTGGISRAAWSPDGALLAVASSKNPGASTTVALWRNVKSLVDTPFNQKAEISSSFVFPPGGSWTTVTWEPTGQIIALGDSLTNFSFFDRRGNALKTFVPHPGIVPKEAHWHGNLLVTWGPYPEKTFKVWAISTKPLLMR
jgi:WD40 repeat protein